MYASFSGQTLYNDWYLSLFNVFFSSLPVIAMGVFDQDVSARFCLKVYKTCLFNHFSSSFMNGVAHFCIIHSLQFPVLYQEGVQNILFSWRRIIAWMLNGFYSGTIIFFFCMKVLEHQAFNEDGKTVGREILGGTMYTCIVWVVNLQMALAISYFTMIQHIVIWGSIGFWYLFQAVYGAITPSFSTNAYQVFVEALAPAPSYWIVTIFVVIATLSPYFFYSAIQMRFFPMYHNMIQWIRYEGHANDPEFCDMVRQRSIRPTTVGSTARRVARTQSARVGDGSVYH